MAELIFNLVILAVLLMLGLFAGGAAERYHLRRLAARESANRDILVTDVKSFPGEMDLSRGAALVTGEVVIATDYLKTFFAKFRKIIGGEVRSFETLLTRARREALVRLVEEARLMGHGAVCNVRLETSMIGRGASRSIVTVGVVASGTAYTVATT